MAMQDGKEWKGKEGKGMQVDEVEKKSREALIAVAALLLIAVLSGTVAYLFPMSRDLGDSGTPTGFSIVAPPPSSNPTYTSVITTAYYIPSYADFQGRQWCTICRENLGGLEACKLDDGKKGAYEAGICNGQLFMDGKYYGASSPKNLKPTREGTVSTGGNPPRTSTGTAPEPHRTVAVNSKKGSACYIPYGSSVYIKFEEEGGKPNPWTGWYVAEDTGSAFSGRCKIDIFVGAGQEALNNAIPHISGKNPSVWVCDANRQKCGEFTEKLQQQLGTYEIMPHFSASFAYNMNIYDEAASFASAVISNCKDYPQQCLALELEKFNKDREVPVLSGSDVQQRCDAGKNPAFRAFAEQLLDCMHNRQSDCLCEVAVPEGLESGQYVYVVESTGTESTVLLKDTSSAVLQAAKLPGKLVSYRLSGQQFSAIPESSWESELRTLRFGISLEEGEVKFADITLPGLRDQDAFRTDTAADAPSKNFGTERAINSLRFYKETEKDVSLVHFLASEKEMCKPVKEHFRMCMIPPEKLPSPTGAESQVPISFALELPDPAPLPITNPYAQIGGTPATGIQLDISWTLPKLPGHEEPLLDMAKYEVYCSPDVQSVSSSPPVVIDAPAQNPSSPTFTFSAEIPACNPIMGGKNVLQVVVVDTAGQRSLDNKAFEASS